MTLPKIILIGKIGALVGATVIIGGVAMYLNKDKDSLPEQAALEQSLLKDYKELSEKVGVTEANLLSNCAKPYIDKIFKLTADLENIKKTKQRSLDSMERDYKYDKAMSNPIPEPGSRPLDFEGKPVPVKDQPMTDEEFDRIMSEYVPEIGSEVPHLDSSEKPVDLIALYDELIRETQMRIDQEIDKIKSACENVVKEDKRDCEASCRNYTHKCLSLVPNADQNLFTQGLMSCMEECRKWDDVKVGCIRNANDCPAMTETCGL